jgi:hypothetical protein
MDKVTLKCRPYVKFNSARKRQGKFKRKFPRVQVPSRKNIHMFLSKSKNWHVNEQETNSLLSIDRTKA